MTTHNDNQTGAVEATTSVETTISSNPQDMMITKSDIITKKENTAKAEVEKKVETRKFKDVKLPEFKEFLSAGVQFGHQTNKWNPKMAPFIHSSKNNIHIIDLEKTLPALSKALTALQEAAYRGNVLMVGSKGQVSNIVKEQAIKSGANFITNRWPGGVLTNYKQISKSLKRLNELELMFEEGVEGRTKQEIAWMKADWERLNRLYGGVKNMNVLPSALFIVDTKFEKNAVLEAKALGIPVIGIVDTNGDPSIINYPIPANDDANGSLKLLIKLVGDAIAEGNQGGGVKHMFKDYKRMDVVRK